MAKLSLSNSYSEKIYNLVDDSINFDLNKRDLLLNVTFQRSLMNYFYKQYIWFFSMCLSASFLHFHYHNVLSTSFIVFIMFIFIYSFLGFALEESIMVVKNLGYQATTKYTIGEKSRFIPWNQIEQIFINEVISRDKVVPLLTLLIKNSGRTIEEQFSIFSLFEDMKPRLKHLEIILNKLHDLQS